MLFGLRTQCLNRVLRRLLLLTHHLQQGFDLLIQTTDQIPSALMQIGLRRARRLVHLLLATLKLREHRRKLFAEDIHRACDF